MAAARNTARTESPDRAAAARGGVPGPDIEKFLDGFKLPGVDLKSIVDAARADIRAVALANRRAHDGLKALVRRQVEMLRQASEDWRVAVKTLAAMDADELLTRRTELARRAIHNALAQVRELAEMNARSQAEACAAAMQGMGARRARTIRRQG